MMALSDIEFCFFSFFRPLANHHSGKKKQRHAKTNLRPWCNPLARLGQQYFQFQGTWGRLRVLVGAWDPEEVNVVRRQAWLACT